VLVPRISRRRMCLEVEGFWSCLNESGKLPGNGKSVK
jgi:hypothetical protein